MKNAGLSSMMFSERKCPVCGNQFYPIRETQRLCSRQCTGVESRGKHFSDESKAKLSKSQKEKYKSGTRKPQPKSAYEKTSKTLREGYLSGRIQARHLSSEKAKEMRALYPDELRAAQLRELSKEKIGVPNPIGPSAKGESNWKARYWILKTPDRKVISGWNLSEIVRKNEHLFDEKDLIWGNSTKSKGCNATKRLQQLFQMKKDKSGPVINSWKGWTAVDRCDYERNY